MIFQLTKNDVKTRQEIILGLPYQDFVVQEIFRHMVAQTDHDLRFFIQIIDAAAQPDKRGVAFQYLEDVLKNNPEIFKNLTDNLVGSGNSLYPRVPPALAKKGLPDLSCRKTGFHCRHPSFTKQLLEL